MKIYARSIPEYDDQGRYTGHRTEIDEYTVGKAPGRSDGVITSRPPHRPSKQAVQEARRPPITPGGDGCLDFLYLFGIACFATGGFVGLVIILAVVF